MDAALQYVSQLSQAEAAMAAGAAVLAIVAINWLFSPRQLPLPPIVKGWPIVGSAFDMPSPANMWAVKVRKEYGEICTVKLGPTTMVMLNSPRVVHELMEKKSNIYSGRPYRPNANDISSGDGRSAFMQYGPKWRNQRKIKHSVLNGVAAETNFRPHQEYEMKILALDLLDDPGNFIDNIQRFGSSVMASNVFGRRMKKGDHFVRESLGFIHDATKYLFDPIKNTVDIYPALENLPRFMQWWRGYGESMYRRSIKLYGDEYEAFQERYKNGTAMSCFLKDVLDQKNPNFMPLSWQEKVMMVGSLMEAGTDTTRTGITQSLAAMIAYPEWVSKARSLIDAVCGANAERLPNLDDRAALPYVTGATKELLRWRPFLALGFPHAVMEDDEFEGYRIPKGTTVAINSYGIALDEKIYPEPEVFRPERFLNEHLEDFRQGHHSFGAGRRFCAGYKVGANNLWLGLATIIYCFDVKEDPAHPLVDTFNIDWHDMDHPFYAVLTPRSKAHADLVRRSAAEALASDF